MASDVQQLYRKIIEDPDVVADNETSKEDLAIDMATQRVAQHERNLQANNLGSSVSKLLQFVKKAEEDEAEDEDEDEDEPAFQRRTEMEGHIFDDDNYSEDDATYINHISSVDYRHGGIFSQALQELKDKVELGEVENPQMGNPPLNVIRMDARGGATKGSINIGAARAWLKTQGGELAEKEHLLSIPPNPKYAAPRRTDPEQSWSEKVHDKLEEEGGTEWEPPRAARGQGGRTAPAHKALDRKYGRALRALGEHTGKQAEDTLNQAYADEAERLGIDITSAGDRPKIEDIETTSAESTAQRIVRRHRSASKSGPQAKAAGEQINEELQEKIQEIVTDNSLTTDEQEEEVGDLQSAVIAAAISALGIDTTNQIDTSQTSEEAVGEHTGRHVDTTADEDTGDEETPPNTAVWEGHPVMEDEFGARSQDVGKSIIAVQMTPAVVARHKAATGRAKDSIRKEAQRNAEKHFESWFKREFGRVPTLSETPHFTAHEDRGVGTANWPWRGVKSADLKGTADADEQPIRRHTGEADFPSPDDKPLVKVGEPSNVMGKAGKVAHTVTGTDDNPVHYVLTEHEDGGGSFSMVNALTGETIPNSVKHFPTGRAGGFEKATKEYNELLTHDGSETSLEGYTPETTAEGEAPKFTSPINTRGRRDVTLVTPTREKQFRQHMSEYLKSAGEGIEPDSDEMTELLQQVADNYATMTGAADIGINPDSRKPMPVIDANNIGGYLLPGYGITKDHPKFSKFREAGERRSQEKLDAGIARATRAATEEAVPTEGEGQPAPKQPRTPSSSDEGAEQPRLFDDEEEGGEGAGGDEGGGGEGDGGEGDGGGEEDGDGQDGEGGGAGTDEGDDETSPITGVKSKGGQYRFRSSSDKPGVPIKEGGMPRPKKGVKRGEGEPVEQPEEEEKEPETPVTQQTMDEALKRKESGISTQRGVGEREEGDEKKSALLDKADRAGIFEYLSDIKSFSHTTPQEARENLAELDIDKLKTELDKHQSPAHKHLLSKEPEAEPVKKDRKKLEEHLARLQGTTADDEFKEDHQYLSPDELEKEINATVKANRASEGNTARQTEATEMRETKAAALSLAKHKVASLEELPEGTGPIQAQQRTRELMNIAHNHAHVLDAKSRTRLNELTQDAAGHGANLETMLNEAKEQAEPEKGGFHDEWLGEHAQRAIQDQAEHDEYQEYMTGSAGLQDRADAHDRSDAELVDVDAEGRPRGLSSIDLPDLSRGRSINKPPKILGQTPEQQEAQQKHHAAVQEGDTATQQSIEDEHTHLAGTSKSDAELEQERIDAGRPPGPPPTLADGSMAKWNPGTQRWTNPKTVSSIQDGLKNGEVAVMQNGLHAGTADAHLDDPNGAQHASGGHKGNMNPNGSFDVGKVVVSKKGTHAAHVPEGPATAKNLGPLGHKATAAGSMGAAVEAHMNENTGSYLHKLTGKLRNKVVVKNAHAEGSHFQKTGLFASEAHAPPSKAGFGARAAGAAAKLTGLDAFRQRLERGRDVTKMIYKTAKPKPSSSRILFKSGKLSQDSKQSIREKIRNAQLVREIEEVIR